MTVKYGSSIPLTDNQACSLAPARAEVIQSLTGNTAQLYELATGSKAGDRAVTPLNPQGELGVDLSGPPWGSCLLTPIWTMSGKKPNTAEAYGRRTICTVSSTSTQAWMNPIFVRPHAEFASGIAPLSAAQLAFIAYLSAAGSVTLSLTWQNYTIGDDEQTTTFTVNSTSETTFLMAAGTRIRLVGGINRIGWKFSSSASSPTVSIASMSLNVGVKRAW